LSCGYRGCFSGRAATRGPGWKMGSCSSSKGAVGVSSSRASTGSSFRTRASRKSMPLYESDKRRLGGGARGVSDHQPDALRVLANREPGRETQRWFAFHGQPPRPARPLTSDRPRSDAIAPPATEKRWQFLIIRRDPAGFARHPRTKPGTPGRRSRGPSRRCLGDARDWR
jgi:hypothetical protein